MDRSTDHRLTKLGRRFAEWRRERERGARIPDELWQEVGALAAALGVSKVATCLRLDYPTLFTASDS